MTTQTLNKYCMRSNSNDLDFLGRWLHGRLTDEELDSMPNREDYEDMLEEMGTESNGNATNKTEKNSSNKTEHTKDAPVNKDSFIKFVAAPVFVGAAGWLVFKSLIQIL